MVVGGQLGDKVSCGLDIVVGESFDQAIPEVILNGAGFVVVDELCGGDGVGKCPTWEGVGNETLAVFFGGPGEVFFNGGGVASGPGVVEEAPLFAICFVTGEGDADRDGGRFIEGSEQLVKG